MVLYLYVKVFLTIIINLYYLTTAIYAENLILYYLINYKTTANFVFNL